MISTEIRDRFESQESLAFASPRLSHYFESVISRIDNLRGDFDVTVVGEVPMGLTYLPIYRLATPHLNQRSKHVLLTAGVHGNEPGGVCGALNFLESDAQYLNSDIGIVCYPCLNPRGLILNSRWNGDGPHSRTDLNRNFLDGSIHDEIQTFTSSLAQTSQRYIATIDLHETMLDDSIVMAMQYPDRDINSYEKSPDSFYMWEICHDQSKRVGVQVINKLKEHSKVCDWERIFDDVNSGGVIFYPEGAVNADYSQKGPLDSFLYSNFTDHAFTTETYGDTTVAYRGDIQQMVIRLIISELSQRITPIKPTPVKRKSETALQE